MSLEAASGRQSSEIWEPSFPAPGLSSYHWPIPADITLSDPQEWHNALLDCRTKTLPFDRQRNPRPPVSFPTFAETFSRFTLACHGRSSAIPCPKAQSSPFASFFQRLPRKSVNQLRQAVVTRTKTKSALAKNYQIGNCHLIRSSDNPVNSEFKAREAEENYSILCLKASRAFKVGEYLQSFISAPSAAVCFKSTRLSNFEHHVLFVQNSPPLFRLARQCSHCHVRFQHHMGHQKP